MNRHPKQKHGCFLAPNSLGNPLSKYKNNSVQKMMFRQIEATAMLRVYLLMTFEKSIGY